MQELVDTNPHSNTFLEEYDTMFEWTNSIYKQKMKNPVVHDFIVLLFVYFDLLNTKSNRNMRVHGLEDLEHLFDDVFLFCSSLNC